MPESYQPCLFDVADSWQEKWRFIRTFATKWHGVKFSDRADLIPLVKQTKSSLGLQLPASFKEYIVFSADANSVKRPRVIRDDYQVEYLKQLNVVSLLRLSEGDAFWAVKVKDLMPEDPPVQCFKLNKLGMDSYDNYALTREIKEAGFKSCSISSPCISDFALEQVLFFTNNGKGAVLDYRDISDRTIQELDRVFARKSQWGKTSIYEKPNIIAILNPYWRTQTKHNFLSVRLWKTLTKAELPDFLFWQQPSGYQHTVGDGIDELMNF